MKKVYVSPSIVQGRGVFAGERILQGEMILCIDDSRVIKDEKELDPSKGGFAHHCDYLANGKIVYMQEPERYINHCCEPNAYVKWIDSERYVIARKDIEKDQEITYDYCIDSYGDTIWQCNCGHPKCRKTINADFYQLPIEKQKEYFPYLSDWFINETRAQFEKLRKEMGF